MVWVRRRADGVDILDTSGATMSYDRVILACHTDQALRILDRPTEQETSILSAIPYSPNRVLLHRDDRLMPTRKKVWASWNYLRSSDQRSDANVAVSYWMNRLQGIDASKPLFVTLNPDREPAPETVFAEFSYDHPQFGTDAMEVQKGIEAIQGHNATSYAGAWTGYGFHEDGLLSGIRAAERLGATFPWRTQPIGLNAADLEKRAVRELA